MENKNIDGYELLPVAKIDLGAGWDWDEMEIYYIVSERRFFWLSGQGCSCDYLWADYPNFGSLHNGFRKDVVNAIRSYISDKGEYAKKDGLDAIAQVMSYRIP
jgi:hypothetical protein